MNKQELEIIDYCNWRENTFTPEQIRKTLQIGRMISIPATEIEDGAHHYKMSLVFGLQMSGRGSSWLMPIQSISLKNAVDEISTAKTIMVS